MKTCGKCSEHKPLDDFMVRSANLSGRGSWCKSCSSSTAVLRKRAIRAELLAALGDECVRCGFDDPRALQVDHVNSDGPADRRNCPDAASRYRRALKEVRAGSSRYQLLCANCNWIKRSELQEWFAG